MWRNHRCIAQRSVSGSTRSPSAVDPTTSAKIVVTTLRRSPATGTSASGAPQPGQNRERSSVHSPQRGHGFMARSYGRPGGPASLSPMTIPAGLQVPFDHELITVRPGPRTGYPFIVAIHSTRATEPAGRAGGGRPLARHPPPPGGPPGAPRPSPGKAPQGGDPGAGARGGG